MPRYITVEDALNAMCDNCDAVQAVCPHYPCKRYMAIESIPTADVQEVVRCKDCMHRPTGTGVNHDLEFPDYVCPCQCEDYWYSWMPSDDWFCADGERRDE